MFYPFPHLARSVVVIVCLAGALGTLPAAEAPKPAGPYYGAFRDLPVSEITPKGWLAEFLQRQRDGLATNHAVSGFPFDTSFWVGPPANTWSRYEQTAYMLDGFYKCGLLIGDKGLHDFALTNIRYVLDHPNPDGRLGLGSDFVIGDKMGSPDWPFQVFSRLLMQYYLTTGDPALLPAMTKHYLTLRPEFGKGGLDINNVEGLCWTYGQTGDQRLIDIAERSWNNFTTSRKSLWNAEHLEAAGPMKGHAVVVSEEINQPTQLYLYTGKKDYLAAARGVFKSLERDHELVDGVVSGSESLYGKQPEKVHETCDIVAYAWSLGYLMAATGEGTYGDKVERAVFNAGFGALDKDFKALQYFSSPNQVVSNQTCSAIKYGPSNADRQAYRPGSNVQCCTGNVQRLIPNYAARLWMSDNHGGIAATLYAPSILKTRVGAEGVPITIEEKTDYPFNGAIDLQITAEKPVKFPLYVRIPAWAADATVAVNGQPAAGKPVPGTFLKLERTFASGDSVKLDFPMKVRMETPVADGVTVVRGPLVYSLKIKEDRKPLQGLPQTGLNFPAWDIAAASPWNYTLDLKGPEDIDKIKVETKPVAGFPWTADNTPVVLTIPARQVEGWTITEDGKNPALPVPPLKIAAKTEQVQLIPDGATQLRVTVFPVVK